MVAFTTRDFETDPAALQAIPLREAARKIVPEAQRSAPAPCGYAGVENGEKDSGTDLRAAAAGALALLDHGLVDEARRVLRLILGR